MWEGNITSDYEVKYSERGGHTGNMWRSAQDMAIRGCNCISHAEHLSGAVRDGVVTLPIDHVSDRSAVAEAIVYGQV